MGSTGEDIELVRRGYAAFSTGDMATLTELFAEDAVWHSAGSGVMSGEKQGRDAILAHFGELMARSGGTLHVDLLDLGGSEDRVFALQHSLGEREGKVVDQDAVNVFTLAGGKVSAVHEFFSDTGETDTFWA
jgi:hypothetical protein